MSKKEANAQHFQVGDLVEWTSQSGGYVKTKHGTVVAVVPPNGNANKAIPDGLASAGKFGFGCPRPQESYLIQIGKRKRLYWPLVKYLTRADVKHENNKRRACEKSRNTQRSDPASQHRRAPSI